MKSDIRSYQRVKAFGVRVIGFVLALNIISHGHADVKKAETVSSINSLTQTVFDKRFSHEFCLKLRGKAVISPVLMNFWYHTLVLEKQVTLESLMFLKSWVDQDMGDAILYLINVLPEGKKDPIKQWLTENNEKSIKNWWCPIPCSAEKSRWLKENQPPDNHKRIDYLCQPNCYTSNLACEPIEHAICDCMVNAKQCEKLNPQLKGLIEQQQRDQINQLSLKLLQWGLK